jgi:hypothetical protein
MKEEVKEEAKEMAMKSRWDEREAKAVAKKVSTKEVAGEQREEDGDVAKETEEEKWKNDEHALNKDTSPMETNLPETSTEVPSGHFQFDRMELVIHTYKPTKVVNLKKFKFDNATGRIIQQQVKKFVVT